jgi:hypothetical protein
MNHDDAFAYLNEVHTTLARQTDLSPDNEDVNSCLTRFVTTLQNWQRNEFGGDLADMPEGHQLAEDLPRLCANAECQMEKWWCRKILASECVGAQALTAFWYLDEYRTLCQSEVELLGGEDVERFAFLGSGAMPITAILLARHYPDAVVSCVDQDAEACEFADGLIRLLGLSQRVRVEEKRAEDYVPDRNEAIICASLLQAPSLYDRLRGRQTRRVIVRDAEGPYRFCYRPAPLPTSGYVQRAKSAPTPARINTSRYFELSGQDHAVDLSHPASYVLA